VRKEGRREYVQYGCGFCAPSGWRNFDASPTLVFERIPLIGLLHTKNSVRFPENVEYGNIVKGLPVPDDSCRGVYCSHVLEHLALQDFRTALHHTYRIMKAGACFRLVVPDLTHAVETYANNFSSDAAMAFLKETGLGTETRRRGLKGALVSWLSNSQHLWMWDYKSMSRELHDAGFTSIREAQMGDADDPMFEQVEELSRWKDNLGVECRK